MLPKPLEPTDPYVRVNFAQVDMPTGPLGACTIAVPCRHGDVKGTYDLLMVMTTEGAVLGGRETFGEPKKIGDVTLTHEVGDKLRFEVEASVDGRPVARGVLTGNRGFVIPPTP